MTYMLDTNICIYAIKKDPQKIGLMLKENLRKGVCISAITLAELEHGVAKSSCVSKNSEALGKFLSLITVLPFDSSAAREYGDIIADLQKKGTPIGTMDMLIAAHARSENLILITNNEREFLRVEDLKVENWI